MPNEFDDDILIPEGFNTETGEWDVPPEEVAPTTEPESSETNVVEETAEVQEPTTTPEPEVKPTTVRVKYNHEERELSLDEAAAFAQKGMNYDKMVEKLNGYEATNAKSNRLAKNLGFANTDEMLAAAEQNYINRQIRELQDAGNTEAMARFLVEQRMKEQNAAEEAKPAEVEQEVETTPKIPQARMDELQEFVNAYPGITKLPDEVIQANRNGTRLLVAYEQYKNKAAQAELAILKQNQASAAKAPVSGTVGKAPAPTADLDDDPFMKGFSKAY